MLDAGQKPKWGWIELLIVYIGTVLLTLLGTTMVAETFVDTMSFFVVATILQFCINIGLIFLIVIFINKAGLADLGLNKPSGHDLVMYGLFGGTLLMIGMILLGIPLLYLQPDVDPQPFEQMLRSAGQNWQFLVLLFLGVVTAPVAEELFFRGMLYPVFRASLGPWWGAAAAGLIFGLAHWDLWRTIPLAIGGAVLCYMYEKTGNIWVTMLAHGTWNGLMSLMVYFNFLV